MGCYSVLQRIFLTQGWNPHLLHCRQIIFTIWGTRKDPKQLYSNKNLKTNRKRTLPGADTCCCLFVFAELATGRMKSWELPTCLSMNQTAESTGKWALMMSFVSPWSSCTWYHDTCKLESINLFSALKKLRNTLFWIKIQIQGMIHKQ